jgi:hypothetical protein
MTTQREAAGSEICGWTFVWHDEALAAVDWAETWLDRHSEAEAALWPRRCLRERPLVWCLWFAIWRPQWHAF